MKYTHDSLTPEDYIMYRLYRFGETGRFGKIGPAKAGKHHGNVTARAWMMYETGQRQPRIGEREKIARWLNAQAARQDRRKSERQEPERREVNRAVKEQVLGGDYEDNVLAKPI